ncbi:plasmid pRiA4b ORF-3 family protein [Streptococcus tangpeifui]|uniref:plasmid pRiA4b ORF-3 family protein n=1 Tax=Streptococcus tangpeifui TaxID=2709400 RepID=UPI001F152FDB|nr:plasmid pRiA4b ORF-3 family protein [Streptococcus sp. ZJ1593]
MTQNKQAWMISVKLGKGCYRHLQVPKTTTLEDLAEIILQVFDFYNDHAHAFFMDNRVWSDDAYYLTAVDLD